MNKWDWVKSFILPTITAIISIWFTQRLQNEKIEISYYEYNSPTVSPIETKGIVKLLPNDKKALSMSSIELKNTGDIALKEIRLLIQYIEVSNDFELLKTYHSTIPNYEFGEIQEEKSNFNKAIKIQYEILNPGDKSTIQTSLRGEYKDVKIFSKAENLNLRDDKYQFEPYESNQEVILILIVFLGTAFSLVIFISIRMEKHKLSDEQLEELEKAWQFYLKNKDESH